MRWFGRRAPGRGSAIFTGHSLSRLESGFVMLASATLSRRDRLGSSLSGRGSSPLLTGRLGGGPPTRDTPPCRAVSAATSPPAARPFAVAESAPGLRLEQATGLAIA